MNVILFDFEKSRKNLLPLTYTRPISEIRIGILTIKEKWDKALNTNASYFTTEFLSRKFPLIHKSNSLLINGSLCPKNDLISEIKKLKPQQALLQNNELLALVGDVKDIDTLNTFEKIEFNGTILMIKNVWDIFQKKSLFILKKPLV